jgi:uncharacterized membrane protein
VTDVHPSEEQLLARRLVPHRSLSHANFRILITLFALTCCVSSLPFLMLGAWPVAGFLGLDVALLWYAFRVNFRDAQGYEDVLLTPIDLRVAKVTPRGQRYEWHFSPNFVRLETQAIEEFGITRLDVVSRGRRVQIADCLGPSEKADFARDLERALTIARRGPRFS